MTLVELHDVMGSRGLAIMGSHKWWSDNKVLNATGIEWCNLYILAKDKEIV